MNALTQVHANEHLSLTVTRLEHRNLQIIGTVKNPERYHTMQIMAANPIPRMTSYHGSGLPYPCPAVAMENTPNRATIPSDGIFDVIFTYPNSYYMYDGRERIPPSVFVTLVPNDASDPIVLQFRLEQDDPLSLRSLTHRPGRTAGPIFYAAKDVLMGVPTTAENVMRTYKDYKIRYDHA